ncbi:unnamed protein product, partial [Staurois parvus]
MRCPWYLFHRLFGCGLSVSNDTGAPWSPIIRGPHELSVHPWPYPLYQHADNVTFPKIRSKENIVKEHSTNGKNSLTL